MTKPEATPEPAAPTPEKPAKSLLDEPNNQPTGDEPKPEPTGDQPDKQPEPKPGEGDQPKPEDKPKDDKPAGAPEQYQALKLPDGFEINEDIKKEFDATSKKTNLTQEQYQEFADLGAKMSAANRSKALAEFERQKQEWATETKKQLGHEPEKALVLASKAIDRIFTDVEEKKTFRAMMSDTGMGNWFPMVKVFQFIGKALAEDTFVPGKPGNPEKNQPAENRIFDKSPTTPTPV